jgi:hypothetical protein
MLLFNRELQRLLKEQLVTCDFEYEARSTVKVVKAIRRDMFEWNGFESWCVAFGPFRSIASNVFRLSGMLFPWQSEGNCP